MLCVMVSPDAMFFLPTTSTLATSLCSSFHPYPATPLDQCSLVPAHGNIAQI